jgi:hypothetical protein
MGEYLVCASAILCSASSIYSVPIDQRAHEAQEGEGDEEGDEGGEVRVHVSFVGLYI